MSNVIKVDIIKLQKLASKRNKMKRIHLLSLTIVLLVLPEESLVVSHLKMLILLKLMQLQKKLLLKVQLMVKLLPKKRLLLNQSKKLSQSLLNFLLMNFNVNVNKQEHNLPFLVKLRLLVLSRIYLE